MKSFNVNNSQDTTFEQRSENKVQAGEINESVEYQNQITTFVDDNPIITEQIIGDMPQPVGDVKSVSDIRNHSVIDFLSRPQFIGSYPWATANVQNDAIFNLEIPTDLMTSMVREKLSGFTSFSASVVFHVQVNAHPFQCGRLVLAALPIPALLPANRIQMINQDISNVITLPHVQLDISKETEVLLKVPYVSPFVQYDLITKFTPWSQFFARVYSPLNTPAAATLQVNVFAHFEDIKLGFPTSALVAQIGDEQKGPISGLVSTLTGVVGGVSQAVKGVFPNISKYSDPLVSIGNGLGGLLSALGFSKPITLIPPQVILSRPSPYFNNSDGLDNSLSLGLKYANEVVFKNPFSGTSSDEMALDYVFKIPNYFDHFSFSSTDVSKKVLWKYPVHPQLVRPFLPDGFPSNARLPTLLAYSTGFFKYWRGGLTYTFKFVKTNYHSGRVQITFHPFCGGNDVQDSNGLIVRDEYVYRVVVDLRDQTEVSLVVPFTSLTPYKVCSDAVKVPFTTDPTRYYFEERNFDTYTSSNDMFFTGTIVVSALTPLVSSSAVVASKIDVLVEVKAADDFEVALPNIPLWFPCEEIKYVPPPKEENKQSVKKDLNDGKLEAQVGFASAGTRDIRSSYVEGLFKPQDITGNDLNHSVDVVPSQECIGERILSFAELIKRNAWKDEIVGSTDNYYDPWLMKNALVGYAATDRSTWFVDPESPTPTLFTAISAMYAFYRGGKRLRIVPKNANLAGSLVEVSLETFQNQAGVGLLDAPDKLAFAYSSVYESFLNKGIAEVQSPYYSRVNTSVVNADVTHDGLTAASPDYVYRIASNSGDYLIGESVADDFRLGFLLGAPLAIRKQVLWSKDSDAAPDFKIKNFPQFYSSKT